MAKKITTEEENYRNYSDNSESDYTGNNYAFILKYVETYRIYETWK